jgi:hypothetical protein
MNLKKLEKAAKIYEKIKELDAQIIEIDKFAMMAANQEIKASFELKIENLTKEKEDVPKVGFDGDGSLQFSYDRMMRSMMMPTFIYGQTPQKKDNEYLLKQNLSENNTLNILGILLYEKQSIRNALLSQLEGLKMDA